MSEEKEIKIYVNLDQNNFPEKIEWEATGADFDGRKAINSFLLSVWDSDKKGALVLNLWNNKMLVGDMNIHVHETLRIMADSYRTATGNIVLAQAIQDFAKDFAERAEQQAKEQSERGGG